MILSIQFFILSEFNSADIISNEIPIIQGAEYNLLNRDFFSGLILGAGLVFCFMRLLSKKES